MKTCTSCNNALELSNFSPNKYNKDGLQSTCKQCRAVKERERRRKIKERNQNKEGVVIERKKCRRCDEIKLIKNFYKCISNVDGYDVFCKICSKFVSKQQRERNKMIHTLTQHRKTHKKCNKCCEYKDISEFGKYVSQTDGFYSICKICRNTELKQKRAEKRAQKINNAIEEGIYLYNNKGEKRCSKCKFYKNTAHFHKREYNSENLQSVCKQCMNLLTTKLRRENTQVNKNKKPTEGLKKCYTCLDFKYTKDFRRSVVKSDGYLSICRECASTKQAEKRKMP